MNFYKCPRCSGSLQITLKKPPHVSSISFEQNIDTWTECSCNICSYRVSLEELKEGLSGKKISSSV